jgi:hypothetical protein
MGGMSLPQNLLPEPDPTLLPAQSEADGALAALGRDDDASPVAARFPAYSGGWAALADRAYAEGEVVASYAYARTGYHRGLDALRRSGWKGHGPVPWSHEPNRGFLRCLNALARAASEIGEADEAARCAGFLRDCDPQAADALS